MPSSGFGLTRPFDLSEEELSRRIGIWAAENAARAAAGQDQDYPMGGLQSTIRDERLLRASGVNPDDPNDPVALALRESLMSGMLDRSHVEFRGRPEDQFPQIAQQLDALEGVFGPLMDDDRHRIGSQLASGEMTIGQAIEQLKTLRRDWRP